MNESTTYDHWGCNWNETKMQHELKFFNSMLSSDEVSLHRKNIVKETTILVLGNPGAGKTTFFKFMTSNNSGLVSREVGNETGEFLIEDSSSMVIGRLSNSYMTNLPVTIASIQSLIENDQKSEISLTDMPCFGDTRSEVHEILMAYYAKKYLKNVKKVRLVLLVPYGLLHHDVYKTEFIGLLRSVDSFINDADGLRNNIVLIATKVPSTFRIVEDKAILVSNRKIIENIANFISEIKVKFTEKLKESTEERNRAFLNNSLVILDRLLEMNKTGSYNNINVFRKPDKAGDLFKMKQFLNDRESIRKTLLYESNGYTEISANDVGHTLSSRAENYINCMFLYLSERINNWSAGIFQELLEQYRSNIANYTEVNELKSRLARYSIDLKELQRLIRNSENATVYRKTIEKFVGDGEAGLDVDHIRIFELQHLFRIHQHFLPSPTLWTKQMIPLINYIDGESSWYKFLTQLFDLCTSFRIQSNKRVYLKEIVSSEDRMPKSLLEDTEFPVYKDFNFCNQRISALQANRIEELKNILSLCFLKETMIICDERGNLNITGYYVMTSILTEEAISSHCTDGIRSVGVFAIHKLFVDSDIKGDVFRGIPFTMLAPIWEVIGHKTINISGSAGRVSDMHKAEDGTSPGRNGSHGAPGSPGGNGGDLLGVGVNFKNDNSLEIIANGGTGGSGQDGGNGANGIKGIEGYEKIFANPPEYLNANETWTSGHLSHTDAIVNISKNDGNLTHLDTLVSQTKYREESNMRDTIKVYSYFGGCGQAGGWGGDGGVGGFGGQPGKVLLISRNRNSEYMIRNNLGNRGAPGAGGKGGKNGANGRDIMCFKIIHRERHNSEDTSYWRCTHFSNVTKDCNRDLNTDQNGNSNFNVVGVSKPLVLKEHYFLKDIYLHLATLKHETSPFLINHIKDFHEVFYNNTVKLQITFSCFVLNPKVLNLF